MALDLDNSYKDVKDKISSAKAYTDLKSQYDPDEDRDIESIIHSTGYYSYQ